jgi:hypothetical protein
MATIYSNKIAVNVSGTSACSVYNVNAMVSNGEGSVSPTSATVTCTQSATFTATPYANYVFGSWVIAGDKGTSSSIGGNPITLTATLLSSYATSGSTVALKAYFQPKNIILSL